MRRLYSILVLLVLSATGCGSARNDDANIRATVESEELQDQLQALKEIQP